MDGSTFLAIRCKKLGSQAGVMLDPGNGSVENDLVVIAQVYTEWDRHDNEAMAVYERLIDQNPNDFRGYLAKGVLLRRQGRKGDMQRAFLQARYNAPPEATPILDRVIGNTNGRL